MSVVIPFPKPQTVEVTGWPIKHVRRYIKDNGWKQWRPRLSADHERCWIVRLA